MKIVIIIPGRAAQFIGGFKVLYTYARGLNNLGHEVHLVHTPFQTPLSSRFDRIRSLIVYILGRIGIIKWKPNDWFDFPPNIRIHWDRNPDCFFSKNNADVTLVSFWSSAYWLTNTKHSLGRKFYLVQEYEYFQTALDDQKQIMLDSFANPDIEFLTISPAITELIESVNPGANITSMPNGIEHDIFYQELGTADKPQGRIGFPFREEKFKGVDDLIEILADIRTQRTVSIWTFGSADGQEHLPEWVDYHVRPSADELRHLYNESSIFVTPSHAEGWGLPGSEAMACGAALVSTDSGGVRAYTTHNETALISDVGDFQSMKNNILLLLDKDNRRYKIAMKGTESIKKFTWKKAIERMNKALSTR